MNKLVFTWVAVLGGSVTAFGCGGDASSGSDVEGDLATTASALTGVTLDPGTKFFVAPAQPGAVRQAADLLRSKKLIDAVHVAATQLVPQAVWVEGGTPEDAKKAVKTTMAQAALEKRVPVLVTYNIPFRDCAQYSSGGAKDTAEYKAWIDGVAAGIGKSKALVILEPDSVGIIPYYQPLWGGLEWCQPKLDGEPAPGASPEERFAQLNYAIDSFARQAPNAMVYLDGTHSRWLGTAEAALRLLKAGVDRAQGFFVNVSNYQWTDESILFGSWISKTITAALAGPSWAYLNEGENDNSGQPGAGHVYVPNAPKYMNFHWTWAPGQYADPDGDGVYTPTYTPEQIAAVDSGLAGLLNGATPTAHFVIDTSRNGQGPLKAERYAAAPYNQPASVIAALNNANWCNPPGAGLGLRPTANTGVALLDAYLWIKTPGESDGTCDIAGGARAWDFDQYNPWNLVTEDLKNHFDPLWAMVDPPAGGWFNEQVLQLIQQANPAF